MRIIYLSSPILLLFSLLFNVQLTGQDSGDYLFNDDVMHEINFEFERSDYWEQMLIDFDQFFGLNDQPYIMGSVTIDGELVDSVGVRFKGFTSFPYDSDKKPIKIDFNEYDKSKRYDGLRKLNLNNSFGDPSFHRDVLCYKMLREMGVKAPRTAWAKVYFEGEYWGMYQLIEQVDKEFLDNNFADNDGNLFKNKGWSFLEWFGDEKGMYAEIFDLKTNEIEDDWSGFISLMDVINNSTQSEFEEEIESVFNVDLFLRTLAVDIATNNWDSFMEHGRNWYMYEDAESGIFQWIPWDYNFALGGSFIFDNQDECFVFPEFIGVSNGDGEVSFNNGTFYIGAESPIYTWDFGDGSPEVVEESPVYQYDTPGTYQVCMTVTLGDCKEELCKNVDSSYDPFDCPSFDVADHPADEVYAYVIADMPQCCNAWSSDCEESWEFANDFVFGTGGQNNFKIDQSENERLLISRLMSIDKYRDRYYDMFCQLRSRVMTEDNLFAAMDENVTLIDDAVRTDPNRLYSYESFQEEVSEDGLKSYLKDRMDNLSEQIEELHTCPAPAVLDWKEVVINEFVASNDSIGGQADPDGGYPDWIELYNTTDRTLDLSGIFVSDDLDNLGKWEFPTGTTMGTDSYLILWADNDLDQTGLHVAFKLSKGGESIYISNSDGSLIDSVNYTEQKTNVAYARVPNGVGDFKFWTTTFNANNNGGMSSTQDNELAADLSIYPNPASQSLYVKTQGSDGLGMLELSNAAGQAVIIQKGTGKEERMDVSELPSGMYLLSITSERGAQTQKKVVVVN